MACVLVAAPAAPAPLHVEWVAGRLSMNAEHVPLAQLLHEVARQTGMEIDGLAGLQDTVSVRFGGLPLYEALQRLPVDFALVWETEPRHTPRPVRAFVFRRPTAVPQQTFSLEGRLAEQGAGPQEAPGARGQPVQGLPELAQATPPQEAATGGEQEARARALQDFAQQGNVQPLQQALVDPDPFIQAAAFARFAELDRQGAIAALLDLSASAQPEQREQALALLHQSGVVDEETVLAALRAALADADATVKGYAINALAVRGGAEAFASLHQALHDPDPAIRQLVLESVIQLDDGLPLVQEALADTEESIRMLARSRLESAGSTTR
jgi:hypothetical protein